MFSSDARVRVDADDLLTYPDVSVVCGPLARSAEDREAMVNPCLLAEVLSPSTAEDDRGEKLASYMKLPALQEILLVAHDATRIDVFRRGADGWTTESAGAGETIELALGCALAVDDVFRDPLPAA